MARAAIRVNAASWGASAGAHQRQARASKAVETAQVPQEQSPSARSNAHSLLHSSSTVFGASLVFSIIGASVTGTLARRRRKQLETLTKQLKEANKQLRMERRRERKRLIDASEDDNAAAPYANTAEPVVEAAESPTDTQTASSQTRRAAVIDELQTGKRALRAEDVQEAETRFSRALDMIANDKAHGVHEPNYSFAVECRKALRGLGAAKKLSGDIRSALQYYLRVLELSDVVGDHHGDADVCGTIADLYTELDDFDSAAEYYDRLISCMTNSDYLGDSSTETLDAEEAEAPSAR